MHQYHNEALGRQMPLNERKRQVRKSQQSNCKFKSSSNLSCRIPYPQSPSLSSSTQSNKPQDSAVVFPKATQTMRFLFLTALLALFAGLALANDTIDCRSSNRYGDQNREIVQAINAFCGWTWDLVSSTSIHFFRSFSFSLAHHLPH